MAEDINISPEMINNLVGMLKNSGSNNDNTNKETSENNDNFNNLGDILTNFTSNFNKNDDSNSNNSSIDFETILKIKSIMETLNTKNDPRSNLLYSLKPYLRKSKQSKLDQYANLLKITQVTELFKNEKGESK